MTLIQYSQVRNLTFFHMNVQIRKKTPKFQNPAVPLFFFWHQPTKAALFALIFYLTMRLLGTKLSWLSVHHILLQPHLKLRMMRIEKNNVIQSKLTAFWTSASPSKQTMVRLQVLKREYIKTFVQLALHVFHRSFGQKKDKTFSNQTPTISLL